MPVQFEKLVITKEHIGNVPAPRIFYTTITEVCACARCGLVVDTAQPTHLCAGDVRATASVVTKKKQVVVVRHAVTVEDINQITRQSLLGSFFAK